MKRHLLTHTVHICVVTMAVPIPNGSSKTKLGKNPWRYHIHQVLACVGRDRGRNVGEMSKFAQKTESERK